LLYASGSGGYSSLRIHLSSYLKEARVISDVVRYRRWDKGSVNEVEEALPWCEDFQKNRLNLAGSLLPSCSSETLTPQEGYIDSEEYKAKFSAWKEVALGWREWTQGVLKDGACRYRGSQPNQRVFPSPPPEKASVFLVMAMAPGWEAETEGEAQLRRELAAWSLRRWKMQFKESIEISVIAQDPLDLQGIEGLFHSGTVGIGGVNAKWAAWQEGVLSVSHRLEEFEWVFLASDASVGPLASMDDAFVAMREEDDFPLTSLYVSNSIGGCCDDVSPFALAFHADLFLKPFWMEYWERMPLWKIGKYAGCGVSSPLVPRQNLVIPGTRGAETSVSYWLQCLTSEGQIPLNLNTTLEELRRSYNPFFPLSGLHQHFYVQNESINATIRAITEYVSTIWYPARLSLCFIE